VTGIRKNGIKHNKIEVCIVLGQDSATPPYRASNGEGGKLRPSEHGDVL